MLPHICYRAIAFHDIPLKGGYIVGILIGDTLFQGRNAILAYQLKRIISVSFEIYGYLPIGLIGGIEVTVSYLHCGIVKGVKSIYVLESKVNPKVVKSSFRKQNF